MCRAVRGAPGSLRDSVQIVGDMVPYVVGAAAALAEGDRGVLTRMTPEEIQILVLAELPELMREQMDKAHDAAKVSDLWLGPMEAQFRTRRGHRGE